MVSHHPVKFGARNRCGNGDMEIYGFQLLKKIIPDAVASIRHYCLSKGHGLKADGISY